MPVPVPVTVTGTGCERDVRKISRSAVRIPACEGVNVTAIVQVSTG